MVTVTVMMMMIVTVIAMMMMMTMMMMMILMMIGTVIVTMMVVIFMISTMMTVITPLPISKPGVLPASTSFLAGGHTVLIGSNCERGAEHHCAESRVAQEYDD